MYINYPANIQIFLEVDFYKKMPMPKKYFDLIDKDSEEEVSIEVESTQVD